MDGTNNDLNFTVSRYVSELCKALPNIAPDIELTAIWPKEQPNPFSHPRMTVIDCPAGALSRLFFDQVGIRRIVSRSTSQIIHYPASTGVLFPTVPLVQTIHDLCFLRHPEWFKASRNLYYRLFISNTVNKAAIIIADSQATAQDVKESLGIPEERIRVIPLGVDTGFFRRTQEEQHFIRDKYKLPECFFLYVGTIEPRKNIARLINAWDKVDRADFPHLVIAGRRGWKTEAISQATRSAKHANRLHFLGHIATEDLPALMSAAMAFVWPSLMEGFGLPLLESMACGTPVLTSNLSSMPEVTGDAALLVNPCQEDQITEAMVALATDTRLLESYSEMGRKRAALYPWVKTAELTANVYREVAR